MKKKSPNKPPAYTPQSRWDAWLECHREKRSFRKTNIILATCFAISAGSTALGIAFCMNELMLVFSIAALFLASVSIITHLLIKGMSIKVMEDELERSKSPPLPSERQT